MDDPDLEALKAPRVPHTLDYVGLGATILPFMVSFRSTQSSQVTTEVRDDQGNVQRTTSGTTTFQDPVAMIGGAIGVVAALATLIHWRRVVASKRAMRIGLTLCVLAIGAFHLVVRSGLLS